MASLATAIAGLLLGLPLGVPGLVLGPIAYFTGKSAVDRIDASGGTLSGRSMAVTGWALGIVATAVGAVISLIWFVLILVSLSTPAE